MFLPVLEEIKIGGEVMPKTIEKKKTKKQIIAKKKVIKKEKTSQNKKVKKTKKTNRTPKNSVVSKNRKSSKSQEFNRKKPIFLITVIAIIISISIIHKIKQGPKEKAILVEALAKYKIVGEGQIPLRSPRGVAIDHLGNIYVAGHDNHRVVKFRSDGSVDTFWGKKGKGDMEFNEPSGIAVDQAGNVYVADAWNQSIKKFNSAGEFLRKYEKELYSPRELEISPAGNIYISDTGNACVKRLHSNGRLLNRWGENGVAYDKFQGPFGIWFHPQTKEVYVADEGNRKIKVFTDKGEFIRMIRVRGWQSGVFWPKIAGDAKGHIYCVVDGGVDIYTEKGKYKGTWRNKGGRKAFAGPIDITLDKQGNIYICNMHEGTIAKLRGYSK